MFGQLISTYRRAGMLYLINVIAAFVLGGICAVIVSVNRFDSAGQSVTVDAFYHFLTLHGILMVFLVLVPLIPSTIGHFLFSGRESNRRLRFPRVVSFGWLAHSGAIALLMIAAFAGGLETRWTLAAPISIYSAGPVELTIAAMVLAGISLATIAINTIAELAHSGMADKRTESFLPFNVGLFLWSAVQLVTLPILFLAMILLQLERLLGAGFFDPAMGGDPVLYKHLFWFYAHPSAIATLLPAIGIIWFLVPQRDAAVAKIGKPFLISMAAISLLSVLSWGMHLATGGQAAMASLIFGVFGVLMVGPVLLILVTLLRRVILGFEIRDTGSWFAGVFLIVLMLGIPTGIILSLLSTNVFFHGTSFVTAHVHYLAVGCTVVAFLGGLQYITPSRGRQRFRSAIIRASLLTIAVSGTISFIAWIGRGLLGIPRGNYGEQLDGWFLDALGSAGQIGVFAASGVLLIYLVVLLRATKLQSGILPTD